VTLDARPFVAHYLRECANERSDRNGDDLHALARWAENRPRDDESMLRIASTGALDYRDGSLRCGDAPRRLVDSYRDDGEKSRSEWLALFAEAIEGDRHAHEE
jgi:hypothetical protein